MIQTTIFKSLRQCQGNRALIQVLAEIREGKYASRIHNLRQVLNNGDKTQADRLKRQLPAFTVSATYTGKRLPESLQTYNPLLVLDIDGVAGADIPRLRHLAEAAGYTVACFVSPGGLGLKIIVYAAVDMPLIPANHRMVYTALQEWYAALLGVEVDTSGSDVGRLCFVSYDPELFVSPRFRDWLNDTGELPSDLPLLKPRKGTPGEGTGDTVLVDNSLGPKSLAAFFYRARRRTNSKFQYADGNRNNYVYLFANHCNRMGISREETAGYCTAHFADLPAEEIDSALNSAYMHTAGQEEKPSKRRENYVEQVQEYLRWRYCLRKNVVKGVIEYKAKTTRHPTYEPVTDYWENSVWRALQLEGIRVKLPELRAVIHSDFSGEYNPFVSYFNGLPAWDGQTDHIAALASTVRTSCPDYWLTCLRKWLVAAVACAIDPGAENHSVLLLSGEQGLGKTTWCRHLVPPELAGYVYSGNVDPSSKDASLLMSDCFLIVLDELSGQSRMELNRLKAMITKDSVRERRAYAHNAETYMRRASFVATVNDSQVLTDRTGSRRFLCFEATAIDYRCPVDHAGIYAQALALFRSGFKYWFSDMDITEINANNEPFQQSSPEEELFFTYFRRPERFEAPLYLSSSDILAKLAEKTRLSITNLNVNNLGKMLKRADFEQTKRRGIRLFSVIELTFDQVKTVQKGIGETSDGSCPASDNQDDSGDEANGFKEPELPF